MSDIVLDAMDSAIKKVSNLVLVEIDSSIFFLVYSCVNNYLIEYSTVNMELETRILILAASLSYLRVI